MSADISPELVQVGALILAAASRLLLPQLDSLREAGPIIADINVRS
jgi:hypothetical protein